MTCVNCAQAIKISLERIKGIEKVDVSFELGRVVVEFKEELISPEQIKSVIESLGYRVEEVKGRSKAPELLAFCWLLSLLIMALMLWHSRESLYLQAILSVAVQAVGGYSFYRSTLNALKAGVGNMDLLVALGSTSALIYSLLALGGILHGEPFFETSAFLITFVRTGKFLEEWVKSRALKSLRELFGLQAIKVRVLKGEKEELKSVQEVFVGDTIVLRAGDMVAVDCRLVEGSIEVDESLVSGEGLPIIKREGEKVISGSVVISGFAKAKVEKTFGRSYANLLVGLVEEALGRKPSVQRLSDKVSHYFVQMVILLAFIFFLFWFVKEGDLQKAVSFSLAVLVVSCPCAFGIAVPLALVVGLLRSYREGVLVKNPSVFEKRVDVVILDKTGTLTEGKPAVVKYVEHSPFALTLACGLAEISNHPYSLAIREFCRKRGIKPQAMENCKEEVGTGVVCEDLLLGRSERGVALYRKDTVLAEFYFEDRIREDAKLVLSFLRERGIKVLMLTGDSEDKARAVAEALGIEDYKAGAKPEDKLRLVEELQSKGIRVALVGDGINDAPAMAKADVSFAVGSGADMAKRVGDVILLKGIGGLKTFFENSEKTMRRIRQNLFWAFLYNLLSIPVAGGLFYSKGVYLKPEVAGLLMVLSSLSVVLNSVRK